MAEQRKRLSKKASKILFEIICEESFEGKSIKSLLPATRRISKVREGLWEYIRSELSRRSDEEYDLGTVSAAWYYNLRKIGSCLDQIDLAEDNNLTVDNLRTMEKYVCSNMGDRIRGRGKGNGGRDGKGDVKLTEDQILNLSRQATMDVGSNYSFHTVAATVHVGRAVTLNSLSVKNERGSSNEVKETKKGNPPSEIDEREDATGENEMREGEGMNNDLNDSRDLNETPIIDANHSIPFDTPPGDNDYPMDGTPLTSRYNTAETTVISRNNSTMSVSGYDADNEKGLIKRRRKELKKRAERDKVVKEEDEDENEKEGEMDDDGNDGMVEEEGEDEVENDENEGEENAEKSNEKLKITNLKGMIENLRDHIISLRVVGSIDAIDMVNLADSFDNASKSINNNVNTV